MADPISNLALIQQEATERLAFQNGTKPIETLTQAERKIITDVLFEKGVALEYSNRDVQVGDLVYGTSININSGGFFFGTVLSIPVLSDADVEFQVQL